MEAQQRHKNSQNDELRSDDQKEVRIERWPTERRLNCEYESEQNLDDLHQQVQHENPTVFLPDAVVYPGAVVIEGRNAPFAVVAVLCSVRLLDLAQTAISFRHQILRRANWSLAGLNPGCWVFLLFLSTRFALDDPINRHWWFLTIFFLAIFIGLPIHLLVILFNLFFSVLVVFQVSRLYLWMNYVEEMHCQVKS